MEARDSSLTTKTIVVVGAGPAGMMAAIRAGELGQQVILVEKNPVLGKKLLLSGKGRCNLTNTCGLEDFLQRFSYRGDFLRDAFKKFFHRELMAFFEKRGLKLKVERQLRVFPATDKSISIVEVLKKELEKLKVQLIFRAQLKDIVLQSGCVKGVILSDAKVIPAQRLILATGGVSYPFTGSTGEGMDLARRLGHEIIPFRPGLVPLETQQKYPKLLQGLALKNIRLKFANGEKEAFSEIGELVFTEFGISGPLVLSFSGQLADWLKSGKHVFIEIDLKPALSLEQLHARLLRELQLNSKKTLKNTLKTLLPQKLAEIFPEICGIDAEKKVSYITQVQRRNLAAHLKALHLDITRSRPIAEAMVTRGGVSLKQIDPRTMQSRIIKGLYFAGEMIDIDADTGGFNLQAAFSTGYLAGESAALM